MYHMVTLSPWPILMSFGLLNLTVGLILSQNNGKFMFMCWGIFIMLILMMQWWRDVIREGSFQGEYTFKVISGLKIGMIMFIVSEVMFFISFFWSYLHSSLSPSVLLGVQWPPMGICSVYVFGVPLLNTIVLLTSGVTVTWCHYGLIKGKWIDSIKSLLSTILLGVYFIFLQLTEYKVTTFSMSDGVFGSVFFIPTGFHGSHVFIGDVFLLLIFIRLLELHYNSMDHLGFELAAWYWHFVDVVWLLLFTSIYWWGG